VSESVPLVDVGAQLERTVRELLAAGVVLDDDDDPGLLDDGRL
jgi:hypothetical protein